MRLRPALFGLLLSGIASATPHHRDQTTQAAAPAIVTRITTVTVTVQPGAPQSSPPNKIPTSTVPVSALPEFTSPARFESIVLNTTNTYRIEHDAQPLVYNASLAAFADSVTTTCKMEHSGGPFGENLAIGCTGLSGCIELWGNERDEYNFGLGKFTKDTGHFTQMVWKGTTDVGCAARFCASRDKDGKQTGRGSWYLVCEYWPRGNVGGQFVEMVEKKVEGLGKVVGVRSLASGVKDGLRRPAKLAMVMVVVGAVVLTL
ncbi:SCP-like extracellular protein [Cladorrhinum sp. PSN259]|nr:SCP-like extracellular protein [Cladorrhinum sp. PSN259]